VFCKLREKGGGKYKGGWRVVRIEKRKRSHNRGVRTLAKYLDGEQHEKTRGVTGSRPKTRTDSDLGLGVKKELDERCCKKRR